MMLGRATFVLAKMIRLFILLETFWKTWMQDGTWRCSIRRASRLTNAGSRWLHVPPPGKTLETIWAELDKAVDFYLALRHANIPKKAIENPVMHKYARERLGYPLRQVVQPWWFGEPAFKATGFELIGLPPLVPTNKLVPPKPGTEEHKAWSWVHRAPPGPNRERDRSRTFLGVADAMAAQWGSYIGD